MADLDDIEAEVTAAVAGKWEREVATFRKALLALWSANGQHVTAAQVRALASRLDTSPAAVNAAKALLPAARAGDGRVSAKTDVLPPSKVATAALASARSKPAEAVAEVAKRAVALNLDTLSGVLGMLGPLGTSVNSMRGAASYAVQTAANEAAVSAIEQTDGKVVFVPERDACLDCIDRAGDTGEAATSDPPPLHPHCRCELQEYEDEDVPLALKREAVRSVLRGFSLPSESQAARLRAAKEMLGRRPTAPASVKRYAETAVSKGKFPRGTASPVRTKGRGK
jgi:hypothetical protein